MAQETQKNVTYVSRFIIRDIIKDTDEQPYEEVSKVRSRRILCPGAFVPMELECTTLLALDVFTNPESLLVS